MHLDFMPVKLIGALNALYVYCLYSVFIFLFCLFFSNKIFETKKVYLKTIFVYCCDIGRVC